MKAAPGAFAPLQEKSNEKSARSGRDAASSRPSRRRLPALVGVVAGVLVAGWLWQHPAGPAHNRARRGGVPRAGIVERPGEMSGRRGDARRLRGRLPIVAAYPTRGFTLVRAPRYFANLATSSGDYVVSVRQVTADQGTRGLFSNPSADAPPQPLSELGLSVQVMATNEAAMDRVEDFAVRLTVIDDTGHRLETVTAENPVTFHNGMARMVRLSAPAPNARFLKRIEGEILLDPSGNPGYQRRLANASQPRMISSGEMLLNPKGWPERQRQLLREEQERQQILREGSRAKTPDSQGATESRRTFQLDNVPLPTSTQVYGLMAARLFDPSAQREWQARGQKPLLGGLTFATGKQANEWRRLFPPYTSEPGPFYLPTRLVLLPDAVNRLRLPLSSDGSLAARPNPGMSPRSSPQNQPARVELGIHREENTAWEAPLLCSLVPHVGLNGEITLQLTVSREGAKQPLLTTHLSVWDNTPLVFHLPLEGTKRRLAVWLNLYLDMPPLEELNSQPFPAPFPATKGERGSLLIGQALVQGEPIGLGYANIEIRRLDETGHPSGAPVLVTAPLDKEGRWRFTNLSPGRYRVQLSSLEPYVSKAAKPGSFADYLRRRYGITQPLWTNQTQENVVVRPGSQTTLPTTEIDTGVR